MTSGPTDPTGTTALPPPPPPEQQQPTASRRNVMDRLTGPAVLVPVAVLFVMLLLLIPAASLDHPSQHDPTIATDTYAPGILGFEFLGSTAEVLPPPPEPPTEAVCQAMTEKTDACDRILSGQPMVEETQGRSRLGWVDAYPAGAVRDALLWDLVLIVVYVAMLALLARTGANYRTVSTRRLYPSMIRLAVAAGVLDVVENVWIWIAAVADPPDGIEGWAWKFAAAAAWGKWLLVFVVAFYGLGGLLSLFLPRPIREVLASATDEGDAASAGVPMWTGADDTQRRNLGIAISGGGIRAASISLGALQSLERGHPLGWDTADDVTSVSGGSYMAGGWSLARHAPHSGNGAPRPWAWTETDRTGPRGTPPRGQPRVPAQQRPARRQRRPDDAGAEADHRDRAGSRAAPAVAQAWEHDRQVAERRPAVVATVLTGMALNAAVFLGLLWVISQPLGWFYRWYFALGCPRLQTTDAATADLAYCLPSVSRTAPSVLIWLGLGIFCDPGLGGPGQGVRGQRPRRRAATVPARLQGGGVRRSGPGRPARRPAHRTAAADRPALGPGRGQRARRHPDRDHRRSGQCRGAVPDPAQAAGPLRSGHRGRALRAAAALRDQPVGPLRPGGRRPGAQHPAVAVRAAAAARGARRLQRRVVVALGVLPGQAAGGVRRRTVRRRGLGRRWRTPTASTPPAAGCPNRTCSTWADPSPARWRPASAPRRR